VTTWFIPTRAGNTSLSGWPPASPAVHPHSRGEHGMRMPDAGSMGGSSPLARGTLNAASVIVEPERFIPTRAGNTASVTRSSPAVAVHPHSRGEHCAAFRPRASTGGSSPLARGTQNMVQRKLAETRFIPTRAGNTRPSKSQSTTRPVHPHSRGEHDRRLFGRLHRVGSSPLARGTLA